MQQVAAQKSDLAALPHSANSVANAVETPVETGENAANERSHQQESFRSFYDDARDYDEKGRSDKEIAADPLRTNKSQKTEQQNNTSPKQSDASNTSHKEVAVKQQKDKLGEEDERETISLPPVKLEGDDTLPKRVDDSGETDDTHSPSTLTQHMVQNASNKATDDVVKKNIHLEPGKGSVELPPPEIEGSTSTNWVEYVESFIGAKEYNSELSDSSILGENIALEKNTNNTETMTSVISALEGQFPNGIDSESLPAAAEFLIQELEGQSGETLSEQAVATIKAIARVLSANQSQDGIHSDNTGTIDVSYLKGKPSESLLAQFIEQSVDDENLNTDSDELNSDEALILSLIKDELVSHNEQQSQLATSDTLAEAEENLDAEVLSSVQNSIDSQQLTDVGTGGASTDGKSESQSEKAQAASGPETGLDNEVQSELIDEILLSAQNSAESQQQSDVEIAIDNTDGKSESQSEKAQAVLNPETGLDDEVQSELIDEILLSAQNSTESKSQGAVEIGTANNDGKSENNITSGKPVAEMAVTDIEMNSEQDVQLLQSIAMMSPESAQKAAQAFAERMAASLPVSTTSEQQQAFKASIITGLDEYKQQLAQGHEPGIDLSSLVVDAALEAGLSASQMQRVAASSDSIAGQFMLLVNGTQHAVSDALQNQFAQVDTQVTENNQLRVESSRSQLHIDTADKGVNIHKPEGLQQLHEKIRWMVNARNSMAEIRLDPPELGSMQVRVNVSGDAASVSFVVQSQHAKDALADAMPRLKDMLAEQGITLGESEVRKDNSSQNGNESGQQLAGTNNNNDLSGQNVDDDMTIIEQGITRQIMGGIDYYA